MLSLLFREFLLGGPPDKLEKDEEAAVITHEDSSMLQQIESHSNYLQQEWGIFESAELKVGSSFESILGDIEVFRSKVDDTDLLKKVKLYASLQGQIQLLILAKALSDLERFTHVRDIPDLIHGLMSSLPKHLQSACTIHKKIIATVTAMKSSLLQSFHADFNTHLENNEDSEDAKEMWSNFLIVARDWLVAYALVSLLPTLISDSRSQILEKYTDALDEALTPLWGRFHFHLTSARESKSFEQFVWTFSYAKSFVALLIDLCTQLTSTGQLQKLDQGDFKSAALHQITGKAVRFMRAHLAQAIVDASPMGSRECMRLVESSLDFDHTLSLTFLPTLSVSAVLYDARTIHAQWVKADHHFFSSYMADVCREDAAIYSFRHSFRTASPSASADLGSASPDPRCYSGVFDCLYIFSLGLHRYEYLPLGSQDIFSKTVLEPLLNIAVGLFLYRIRSCKALYTVSIGILPPQSVSDKVVKSSQFHRTGCDAEIAAKFMKLEIPPSMIDFNDSVQYFQSCLGAIGEKSRAIKGCKNRFQENWKVARDDFPEDLIAQRRSERGYSVVEMIGTIMESTAPSESGNQVKDGDKGCVGRSTAREDTSMGGVMDYSRAQVLKMSAVLDSQWEKLQTHVK